MLDQQVCELRRESRSQSATDAEANPKGLTAVAIKYAGQRAAVHHAADQSPGRSD